MIDFIQFFLILNMKYDTAAITLKNTRIDYSYWVECI